MKISNLPDVSVVIPVFNAAQHLATCLQSVLDQTHKNIEIICVNDASQDASLGILKSLSENDLRIRVINLNSNMGASSARNVGIGQAKGKHLFFLDADDSVPLDGLENLLAASSRSECDLVVGKLLWFRSEKEMHAKGVGNCAVHEVEITNVRDSQFLQSIPGCHCCNLYSKAFLDLHNIRYAPDLTYGEDQLFQATAIVKARKVAIIDDVVYFYHHYRSESLTRKLPTLKNLLDDIEYQRRIVRLFFSAGLRAAGSAFLQSWSYAIREYWVKIPHSVSLKESASLFSDFRSLISEYDVEPWNTSTPEHHRHLLTLILAGHDQKAYEFLSSEEAITGFN